MRSSNGDLNENNTRGKCHRNKIKRLLRKSFSNLHQALQDFQFGSRSDANEFVGDLTQELGSIIQHVTPQSPLEQAQDVIYMAWEAETEAERLALARLALQICGDCADAYVLMAESSIDDPCAAKDLFAQGVLAGERSLGKKFFEVFAGQFWRERETRPYMRALSGLAFYMWKTGQREEAIEHAYELLRLNPNDNQGIRYLLAAWLTEMGRDKELGTLLHKYRVDAGAIWAYSFALYSFRVEGDSRRARTRLNKAFRLNAHIPFFMLNAKQLPRERPKRYKSGDENEAISYVEHNLQAWRQTKGALEWIVMSIQNKLCKSTGLRRH